MKKIIMPLFAVSLVAIGFSLFQAFDANESTLSQSIALENNVIANNAVSNYGQAKAINQSSYNNPQIINLEEVSLPKSIEGVGFKPELSVDESRELIPTYAVRELFDHYLSTYGEISLDEIIQLIQSEIDVSLEEPAKSEAFSLLKRYIDFKIALAEDLSQTKDENVSDMNLLERTIQAHAAIQSLREQYFDAEEYQSFFALEDAQNAYMVEQIKINSDQTLSDDEKAQRLEQANALLPSNVVASRDRVQKHASLREKVEQLKSEGASELEIYRARENELGMEAANALSELDRQRSIWKERLKGFATAHSEIQASGLSQQDKESSIQDLLVAHFDVHEHKRVMALLNEGLIN